MRKKTKILALVALATLSASLVNWHGLRQGAGGLGLWNSNEAYLFLFVEYDGYHYSYLRFPWIIVKNYLGAVDSPNENRAALLVVRVTDTEVERHIFPLRLNGGPGSDPQRFTPIDGKIYAYYPKLGGLVRWAGDHFERETFKNEPWDRKTELFPGHNRLTLNDFENDANGWSRRALGHVILGKQLTINVGGKFQLSVSRVGNGTEDNRFLISLIRPGKIPETLLDFDSIWGWVSKGEYEWAFHGEIGKRKPE